VFQLLAAPSGGTSTYRALLMLTPKSAQRWRSGSERFLGILSTVFRRSSMQSVQESQDAIVVV
jgi:hypothetical protein